MEPIRIVITNVMACLRSARVSNRVMKFSVRLVLVRAGRGGSESVP